MNRQILMALIYFCNLMNISLLLLRLLPSLPLATGLNNVFPIPESVVFGPAVGEVDRIALGGHAGDISVAAAGADTNKQVQLDLFTLSAMFKRKLKELKFLSFGRF